jgi:hypothetical protein
LTEADPLDREAENLVKRYNEATQAPSKRGRPDKNGPAHKLKLQAGSLILRYNDAGRPLPTEFAKMVAGLLGGNAEHQTQDDATLTENERAAAEFEARRWHKSGVQPTKAAVAQHINIHPSNLTIYRKRNRYNERVQRRRAELKVAQLKKRH